MTVVPVDVPALHKAEEKAKKDAFKTPNGWTYPGHKTFVESNINPRKPHESRIDELKEVSS